MPQIQAKAEKESNDLLRSWMPSQAQVTASGIQLSICWAGRLKAPVVASQEEGDPTQKEIGHMWQHNVPD